MYPKAIESYFAPTTIDEALRLLAEHRDSAKLLAGGQSLMPMLKLRLVEPGCRTRSQPYPDPDGNSRG
jgi:aerobic carbon-monoxide dehydrogenase medium subunit